MGPGNMLTLLENADIKHLWLDEFWSGAGQYNNDQRNTDDNTLILLVLFSEIK